MISFDSYLNKFKDYIISTLQDNINNSQSTITTAVSNVQTTINNSSPLKRYSQEFTTSGTFDRPSSVHEFDIILVAGGKSGESTVYSSRSGAGGTGGGILILKQIYLNQNSYVIIIGGSNGDSRFGSNIFAKTGMGASGGANNVSGPPSDGSNNLIYAGYGGTCGIASTGGGGGGAGYIGIGGTGGGYGSSGTTPVIGGVGGSAYSGGGVGGGGGGGGGYGAGGGGASAYGAVGGAGAPGYCLISWWNV